MKVFIVYCHFFILCFVFCLIHGNSRNQEIWTLPETPKIAIIGGGVGGCGLAYFLNLPNVQIDLYEKSGKLGGRLDTVEIFGQHYEMGGSIIHPRNEYVVDLVEKLGLRKNEKEPASGFSLLKDHKIVFTSSPWTVVTILRIMYRYGLDFNYIHSFTNRLIDDFSNIYNHQANKISYEHPFEMLAAMSPALANLTRSGFRSFLQSYGLKDIFIDELVQAITFVNYGQDANIHSLVGTIAMAGAAEGLFSIKNGNKQLPLALAKASKAKFFMNSGVQGIIDHQNGTYGISIQDNNRGQEGEIIKNYDIVVIANPLEVSKMKFFNFSKLPYDVNQRRYHRTVSTIVAGDLQENFTLAQQNVDSVFTCDTFTFFTTVSRIFPIDSTTQTDVNSNKTVYKIFSPKPLTEDQLHIIFSKVYEIRVVDWMAYPHYDANGGLEAIPSFLLDERNLYYLNSIEWAASAIEMSLISAKNIALLLAQRIESRNFGEDESQQRNYHHHTMGRKSKPNVEATQKIEL